MFPKCNDGTSIGWKLKFKKGRNRKEKDESFQASPKPNRTSNIKSCLENNFINSLLHTSGPLGWSSHLLDTLGWVSWLSNTLHIYIFTALLHTAHLVALMVWSCVPVACLLCDFFWEAPLRSPLGIVLVRNFCGSLTIIVTLCLGHVPKRQQLYLKIIL